MLNEETAERINNDSQDYTTAIKIKLEPSKNLEDLTFKKLLDITKKNAIEAFNKARKHKALSEIKNPRIYRIKMNAVANMKKKLNQKLGDNIAVRWYTAYPLNYRHVEEF